jgi:hypothetical protein
VASLSLSHVSALLRVAPPADLARAAWRRLRPPAGPVRAPRAEEIARAAEALRHVPRWFSRDDPRPLYQARFPEAIARYRQRAERILDGEAEIFGEWRRLDFDAADPKLAWEAARANHLVELAAAARLHDDLAEPTRALIAKQMHEFLDAGRDEPPLEVAIRGIHWLAAIELCGGLTRFPEGLRPRLAASLLMEGDFLSRNVEDGGVCPANHLIGDWVGLLVRGIATGRRRWVARASAGLREEAARQVGDDGAHFEASTAYHRFALELFWIAQRWVGLGLEPALKRMLGFVRGILAPDGSEPGFGDGDDAHLLPVVPRDPRDHAYLLGLGVAVLNDVRLRRGGAPPEELVWWCGAAGLRAWDAIAPSPDAPAASFPTGGVHILRSSRLYVALRAGSYGQHGVGGHAHNDQLSLVVYADGKPLILDPGTASYTADPVARDRFRGTAAHSTVIVDGEEQSPLPPRPFALPDRANSRLTALDDLGDLASLCAAHDGYRRLNGGIRHERRVTLYRELSALLVEDHLDGEGEAAVELRYHVAGDVVLGAGPLLRARLESLGGRLGALDPGGSVEVGAAALVPRVDCPLRVDLARSWTAPRFGRILQAGVVRWGGMLRLPQTITVAVILLP